MLKRPRRRDVRRSRSIRFVLRSLKHTEVEYRGHRRSLDPVEDIRLARLWLACGSPIADVMTMLEVRHRFELSSDDCRAYAIEILRAAEDQSRTEANRKPTPKELPYAAA